MLANALAELGYTSELVDVDGKQRVIYRHPSGKSWSTSTGLVTYPFNSSDLTDISDNKSKAYAWVDNLGIKRPETIVISTDKTVSPEAVNRLLARHGRVIVKPDASFGSRGVSVNLRNYDQVLDAITVAQRIKQKHGDILVQQHVDGNEYRFTVLNGEVVSVMLRETARVIGDGISTVAELIEREDNERTIVNQTSMVRYPAIHEIIQDSTRLKSNHVLAESEVLILSSSAMVSGGTSVYEIEDKIHESYKQVAIKLANGLTSQFVIVDLFIQDSNAPATYDTVYFNEFNRSPALKMFYANRNEGYVDIARALAQAIDQYLDEPSDGTLT